MEFTTYTPSKIILADPNTYEDDVHEDFLDAIYHEQSQSMELHPYESHSEPSLFSWDSPELRTKAEVRTYTYGRTNRVSIGESSSENQESVKDEQFEDESIDTPSPGLSESVTLDTYVEFGHDFEDYQFPSRDTQSLGGETRHELDPELDFLFENHRRRMDTYESIGSTKRHSAPVAQNPYSFHENQQVLVHRIAYRVKGSRDEYNHLWYGPCRVKEVLNNGNSYAIEMHSLSNNPLKKEEQCKVVDGKWLRSFSINDTVFGLASPQNIKDAAKRIGSVSRILSLDQATGTVVCLFEGCEDHDTVELPLELFVKLLPYKRLEELGIKYRVRDVREDRRSSRAGLFFGTVLDTVASWY